MQELVPLYDKNVACLVCNFKFTTKKVRSRFIKAKSIDTDFCSDYEDESVSPLLYHVAVCPGCGYAFSEDASTYFQPGIKELLMDKITRNWRGQTHYSDERTTKEAIEAYKLALLAGQLKKERPIVMAGINMRLAWMYRKLENEKEEKRFMKYAIEYYEKSYYEGDYQGTDMSTVRLNYLIGELYRRIGDYQKATTFFSNVIQKQNETHEHRTVQMARDQWYIIRDEMKKAENEESSQETK